MSKEGPISEPVPQPNRSHIRLKDGQMQPVLFTPKPDVLVPGSHAISLKEYREVDAVNFAADVLDTFPSGSLYKRANIPGEVIMGEFRPMEEQRMRLMADSHARLIAKRKRKQDDSFSIVEEFRPCSGDNARLLIAAAASYPEIPELIFLSTYPVFHGKDWSTSVKGFSQGVFCSVATPAPVLDEIHIREALDDLTIDFPFASQSDRETFYGLLLTPLIRPAIDGNVPLHLITSPIERSGKTKLASDVLGGIYFNRPTPNLQLTGSEDERDKRILAMLIAGDPIRHLDNLPEFVDSSCLASLLTSDTYQGRLLGQSKLVSVHNYATLVATGNNTRLTGEIGKRTVPIQLQPNEADPQRRTNFKHPDLRAYVRERRTYLFSCLVGAVELWKHAGKPQGTIPMGGFDEWARAVGGIMQVLGFNEWMKSALEWQEQADEFSADLIELVKAWTEQGSESKWATDLLTLAKEKGLFEFILSRCKTARAEQTSFGMSVLKKARNRTVLGMRIKSYGVGASNYYALEKV